MFICMAAWRPSGPRLGWGAALTGSRGSGAGGACVHPLPSVLPALQLRTVGGAPVMYVHAHTHAHHISAEPTVSIQAIASTICNITNPHPIPQDGDQLVYSGFSAAHAYAAMTVCSAMRGFLQVRMHATREIASLPSSCVYSAAPTRTLCEMCKHSCVRYSA